MSSDSHSVSSSSTRSKRYVFLRIGLRRDPLENRSLGVELFTPGRFGLDSIKEPQG
jgi:hypothetical protein